MRLFLLSLLALGSVQSHAVGSSARGYAFRHGLLSYSPARGEFPVQSSSAQGYIRYIDESGAQRLVGYNYPEPLYAVRRLSHGSDDQPNPLLKTSISGAAYNAAVPQQLPPQQFLVADASDSDKTRDDHFRAWCEQRYQALKTEADKLRVEGKRPTEDMLAQLRPLEKILKASSNAALDETTEVQRAREEHLRIWNEARLRAIQADHVQSEIAGSQLKSELGKQQEQQQVLSAQAPIIRTEPQPSYLAAGLKTEVKLSPTGVVLETPEVMRAREEHFRLFNEAKLRAEKADDSKDYKQEAVSKPTAQNNVREEHDKEHTLKSHYGALPTQSHSEDVSIQQLTAGLKSVSGFDAPQQPTPVEETPEVQRAREEHLRLKAELKGYTGQSNIAQGQLINKAEAQRSAIFVQDTPEVVRAREEHLRLVEEANRKTDYLREQVESSRQTISQLQPIQPIQQISLPLLQDKQFSVGLKSSEHLPNPLLPVQIQETPEVSRARAEHLKLVEEANLKASQNQNDQLNKDNILGYIDITVSADQFQPTTIVGNEDRDLNAERLREAERLRTEEKIREAELSREAARLEEEQRSMEAELLLLRQQEELRQEKERLIEAKRLKQEALLSKQTETATQIGYQNQENAVSTGQAKSDIQQTMVPLAQTSANAYRLAESHKENPFLLRFLAQQSAAGANLLVTEQRPITQSGGRFYVPSGTSAAGAETIFKQQSPLLLQYSQASGADLKDQSGRAAAYATQTKPFDTKQYGIIKLHDGNYGLVSFSQSNPVEQLQNRIVSTETKPIALRQFDTDSIDKVSYGQFDASTKTDNEASAETSLSELERATREHFRAHEIALERLRLANFNDARGVKKDFQ